MIMYDLPEAVTVSGVKYPIRWDYRAALDIIAALNDPELNEFDRACVALSVFYSDTIPPDADAALRECFRFLGGGEDQGKPDGAPKLMDWEQDFKWIVAPISKAVGRDVRGIQLHWWTFLSLFYEIGDCTFAQIVSIRRKMQRGRSLDKQEREFYRSNRAAVDLQNRYTAEEDELIRKLSRKEA